MPSAPQTIGVWPPSSDVVIGPPPGNGTVMKSSLSASFIMSIDSDGVVPVPGEPTLCLPGSRRMRSIRSFMVFAGKLALHDP